ncbi:hypothetical protein Ddc_24349 [Ditylenchus destructor]|nr:hypothetical protein Ddc_24349 [Ditylenchus destructor]
MDCTSKIKLDYYELSHVIVEFVQKFIDLKNCDEYQIVESIESNAVNVDVNVVEVVKHNYAKFIVKRERNNHTTKHTFEFVNKDVGKKLQLAIANIKRPQTSAFSLKIESL